MHKTPSERLDNRLLQDGFCRDLKESQALIMAGKVVVDGQVVSKAGSPTKPGADIHVRGRRMRFVGRAGYKLDAALEGFDVPVDGRVVLDAGAATGGFTDCLLQRGARLVYAVDAGYGQIRGLVASDPRVVNMERTNIGDLSTSSFPEPIDMATADLSYLSLRVAAPTLARLFDGPAHMICLVKPMFEGHSASRNDNPEPLAQLLRDLFEDLGTRGLPIVRAMVSPIRGGRGEAEFLILIDEASDKAPPPEDLVARLIHDLQANPPREHPESDWE